ncbi:MAG TPA: DNA translocase FtsK 4TM domain-containing protein [Acidimicrobiia bacterium]|nr:DNA translocase FtsK 4TM domain-containing protein [Acidimicrobiia bacterium]
MTQRLAAIRDSFRQTLGRQTDDVWGLVLIVVAILVILAFFDLAGPVGDGFERGSRFLFGVWRFALPLALIGVGVALIVGKPRDGARRLVLGGITTFVGTLALFHLLTGAVAFRTSIEMVQERGGAVGSLLSFPMRRVLGHWGAFVVLASAIGMGVLIMTNTSVRELSRGVSDLYRKFQNLIREIFASDPSTRGAHTAPSIQIVGQKPRGKHQKPADQRPPKREEEPEPPIERMSEPEPVQVTLDLTGSDYELPPLSLLDGGTGGEVNKKSLEETARQLEDTLIQHGVDAQLTKIVPGPTVTRYEIELSPGVKVNRVSNLSHDIAYALATPDVRILVPIPGKSAIGVEVPNVKRRLVSLGDILSSAEAARPAHLLTVGLGMDISGQAKMLNLAELPHVLIAGATGAGKSSCINSIVTSLLMRATPDDVRLIMVDPKRVELGQYNGVPHLLTRVITNPKKANEALKWAVAEMDRRYDLLADAGARDIEGYREKLDVGALDPEGFDRFPFIVVIIDELNDLMMVAGREVEESIVRIAQMARAVGIHLVIATQRPSVDVITGVIKANIPSRLAFSVASQTDSRVIIDGAGAEKLVGMGDMLVVTAKEPRPQRIQGAWVRETEIHSVVEWVKKQREAQYEDKQVLEVAAAAAAAQAEEEEDDDSELIREAMDLVVRSQLGSTSMLQRKLRIGFARAGRVMDALERKGVVGPSVGSKAREVLMTVEELEEVLQAESSSV